MKDFDERARNWDKPSRVERAEEIAAKIKAKLKPEHKYSILEYGSGTGLLGLLFIDMAESILLVDDSEKMLEVAQEKINHFGLGNIETLKSNFLVDEVPDKKYDLLLIMMTLHHIVDTSLILSKFNDVLKVGGELVIVDLVEDDGTFHDHEFEGHSGFGQENLESTLVQNGFAPTKWEIGYVIRKEREGRMRDYPLFISFSKKEG